MSVEFSSSLWLWLYENGREMGLCKARSLKRTFGYRIKRQGVESGERGQGRRRGKWKGINGNE